MYLPYSLLMGGGNLWLRKRIEGSVYICFRTAFRQTWYDVISLCMCIMVFFFWFAKSRKLIGTKAISDVMRKPATGRS